MGISCEGYKHSGVCSDYVWGSFTAFGDQRICVAMHTYYVQTIVCSQAMPVRVCHWISEWHWIGAKLVAACCSCWLMQPQLLLWYDACSRHSFMKALRSRTCAKLPGMVEPLLAEGSVGMREEDLILVMSIFASGQ